MTIVNQQIRAIEFAAEQEEYLPVGNATAPKVAEKRSAFEFAGWRDGHAEICDHRGNRCRDVRRHLGRALFVEPRPNIRLPEFIARAYLDCTRSVLSGENAVDGCRVNVDDAGDFGASDELVNHGVTPLGKMNRVAAGLGYPVSRRDWCVVVG